MIPMLLLLMYGVAEPMQVTAMRLDGPPVQGSLMGWDSSKPPSPSVQIQVKGQNPIEGKTIALATDQLLALHWKNHTPSSSLPEKSDFPESYVELVDGSRLPLSSVGKLMTSDRSPQILVGDRMATLILAGNSRPLTIPVEQLRAVQLMPAASGANAFWQEVQEKQLAGDVLVIQKRKGESFDYLTGVVGVLTESHLQFQWDGETIPVKRSKVAALAYYHPEIQGHFTLQGAGPSQNQSHDKLPLPICRLVTSQGAILMVAQLALVKDRLKLNTMCGVSLELPVEEMVSADYSFGKLAYLSDLKPQSMQWNPQVGLPEAASTIRHFGEPRNDRPFGPREVNLPETKPGTKKWSGNHGFLTLRWRPVNSTDHDGLKGQVLRRYDKGLALRSRTKLIYRLPRGMRHFRTIAGIDPSTASQGHVHLKITGDQGGNWEGPIDGKQLPVEINLDIQNSNRLTILVDYGKNLDWGDRLHLVNARVTR